MNDAVRVEVVKKKNESSASLIRRFTRRVQSAGIIRKVRTNRYYQRSLSKNVEHKKRMSSLKKGQKFHELVKLGKIDPALPRSRR
jgi:ribosomal protein S21